MTGKRLSGIGESDLRTMFTSTPKKKRIFSSDFDSTFVPEKPMSPLRNEVKFTSDVRSSPSKESDKENLCVPNNVKRVKIDTSANSKSLNLQFQHWVRQGLLSNRQHQQLVRQIIEERLRLVLRFHLVDHFMGLYFDELTEVKASVVNKFDEFQTCTKEMRESFSKW